MNWLLNMEVGDIVFLGSGQRTAPAPAVIEKKGRTLVHLSPLGPDGTPNKWQSHVVDCKRDTRGDRDTLTTRVTCGSGLTVYRDETHFRQVVWKERAVRLVSDKLRFGNSEFTFDQIVAVIDALGLGNQLDAKP